MSVFGIRRDASHVYTGPPNVPSGVLREIARGVWGRLPTSAAKSVMNDQMKNENKKRDEVRRAAENAMECAREVILIPSNDRSWDWVHGTDGV